MTEVQLLIL